MKYLLGIDLGTSGTKPFYSMKTEMLSRPKTVEYPLSQPRNGWGPNRIRWIGGTPYAQECGTACHMSRT